jgi:hypothetical protein
LARQDPTQSDVNRTDLNDGPATNHDQACWQQPAGKAHHRRHEALFCYHIDQLQAVRSEQWKLYLPLQNKRINLRDGTMPSPALLFDVLADPGEKNDLSAKHAEVVQRLTGFAKKAREDIGDVGRPGSGQRPVGRMQGPRALVMQEK